MRHALRLFPSVCWLILALGLPGTARADHPVLYASNQDRAAIQARIASEPWAGKALAKIRESVDPLVARTATDPQFVTSRLAMYWKDGERYTQCYVKKENWDRGEGNAPVPTVRLPGMRVWNDYSNVPLVDRKPFNETGDMLATSRREPAAPAVVVPYKQSGHLIRGNNAEILTLAEKAAFLYWLSDDEKYARFAADIYWTWLLGTYYMNPVLDPERSSGGPGGWEPGGILGFYDYEQIHDDLPMHAAPIYDFLLPYLEAHPHPHLKVIGKDVKQVSGEVFKKFIDIGLVRGGNKGNWNVNGWNVMMRAILVLESDSFYADSKGREHYLKFYTTTTTPHHDALPDILKQYSPVTGLWPEAPGYAFGVINSLLDMAIPIQRAGVDTIAGNPTMQKAAMAIFAWLDPRGNLVVFGDTRGGPANFVGFERLLTYFARVGDHDNARIAATAIRRGMDSGAYDRSNAGWEGLCSYAPLDAAAGDLPAPVAAYSALHRHLVLRNLNDEQNGLMFTLYGGYDKDKHLSPNGLAMQLYGKGWALAPDAAAYESYWSADYAYHQSATGSNTILPGYTAGPIQVEAMEPALAADQFTTNQSLSPNFSFADVSAGAQRRLIAMIRTSPTTGYYVDLFRSRQPLSDYLYHNLGTALTLTSAAGTPIALTPDASLEPVPGKAYSFFKNVRAAAHDDDFIATWTIDTVTPPIHMSLWMTGQKNRTLYQVDAPPTTLLASITPAGANKAPASTPTLIVRQKDLDAWDHPFVAVFEPYSGSERSIARVTRRPSSDVQMVEVQSRTPDGLMTDRLYSSASPAGRHDDDFAGTFAIAREVEEQVTELYLGLGTRISVRDCALASPTDQPMQARLRREGTQWRYTADRDVLIQLPGQSARRFPAARDGVIDAARP